VSEDVRALIEEARWKKGLHPTDEAAEYIDGLIDRLVGALESEHRIAEAVRRFRTVEGTPWGVVMDALDSETPGGDASAPALSDPSPTTSTGGLSDAPRQAPDLSKREELADWLGDRPESFNRRDYTDEETTFITIAVEDLADALLAGPLAGWSKPDPEDDARDGAIIESADRMAGSTEVDRLAIILMRAWGTADPRSRVARFPASFIATFADMARAAVDAGYREPDPEEWEYGVNFEKYGGDVVTWPDSEDDGEENARRTAEHPANRDTRLVRRRPAGPWLPVEEAD